MMVEMLLPAAVVLLGYVVLGITGFGSALVVVPLLAWQWPLAEVVPIVLMLDVMASLLLGGLNVRQVAFSELVHLLPGMVVGALAGLWLTSVIGSEWPLVVLGVYVASVGVQALRTGGPSRPQAAVFPGSHLAGAAIGAVEMMFGTSGPLVVAWLGRRLSDVHALRATAPIVIMVSACAVLLMMGWSGRLSRPDLWWRVIELAGVAAVGVVVGHRCARYISREALRRLICGLLVVSGVSLIAHTMLAA